MSYPDHYLLNYGGELGVGEIWSQNIRMVSSDVLTDNEQQEMCTEAKNAIVTWMGVATSGWSTRSKLSYVKFNRIAPDGTYVNTGVTHRLDFAPLSPSGQTSAQPNNVAIVLTWLTAFMRGPAHKGRVYLPAPAMAPASATGRITAAQALAIANAGAAFLNDLNVSGGTLVGDDIEASVVSNIDETKARITGVQVGDVPDTQRRRRNAYVEVYSISPTAVVDM